MNADRKLAEANYFLFQMRNDTGNGEVFRHSLAAFLGAARSVALYLKMEILTRTPRPDWGNALLGEIEKDEVVAFFRRLRNADVHKAPVGSAPTATVASYTVPSGHQDAEWKTEGTMYGRRFGVLPAVGTVWPKVRASAGETFVRVQWEFDRRPGESVVELCADYSRRLSGFMEAVRTRLDSSSLEVGN